MIPEAHRKFKEWAAWEKQSVPATNLGYGVQVIARIMEGKGEILPGPPKGSGRKRADINPAMMRIHIFVARLPSRDKRVIMEVYCGKPGYTMEEKAARLRMATRTMYDVVERAQMRLMDFLHKNG